MVILDFFETHVGFIRMYQSVLYGKILWPANSTLCDSLILGEE